MKKFITKLKIILQCKYFYFLLFSLTLFYVFLENKIIERNSLYLQEENEFILKVVDIKQNENGMTITFLGKEKLISFYYDEFLYELGDIVKVEGKLVFPSKNTIPNLFNYRKYLSYQKIYYILEVDHISLIEKNQNLFYKIKTSIINYINQYKSKDYLHAFILGNTSYIDDDINSKYLNLGISHLFAISGMHVSLLIMIISFIFNKMRFKQHHSFLFISIFLVFYVFLVNFQVSIIRSVLSYILLSLNKFFRLEIKNNYILILIFSLALLINPFNIYKLGFQYSYLISFVLITYNQLIRGNYLRKMFIISLIAFFCSMPITVMNNFQINLLTVFFNLICVPFVSIIIFPISIISLIFPFLDNILSFLINLLEEIAVSLDKFSIILIFKKPSIIIISMYFVFVFYFLNGWIKRKYWRIGYLLLLILFHYNINFFLVNNYVLAFDVSQGDSALIHYDNHSIMIDTGGSFYSTYSEDIITFMKSEGIRSLQYLVISHGDFDHMGEAINLVENFKVDKVIFNCGEFNNLEQDLIRVLDKKKIPYYSCIKELNIDDNKLYFLNNKDYGNENDNSLVIYTELNNHKFLFMGDASVEVEEDLIEKYKLKDIDVLKVGHHGSKTSSSKKFIDNINPKYSIISVGKNNRYGHPNSNVLDNLKYSQIYRTDQGGSIMFKIKNNKLKIETCNSLKGK